MTLLRIHGKEIGVAKDNAHQDFVDLVVNLAQENDIPFGTMNIGDKHVLCVGFSEGLEYSFVNELARRLLLDMPQQKYPRANLVANQFLDLCLIWEDIEIIPLLN